MQQNRGRPHKVLNEEENIWLIEFLNRSDISYSNPGRKDHVHIGKIDGESKHKQKQYLLWPLREIVSIANCKEAVDKSFESKFNKKLTFSQLYDFLKIHKEYIYNINIPHASCLCEICDNSLWLTKGLNELKREFKERLPNNPHDLVEKFSCDSDKAECMLEKCASCKSSVMIDQRLVEEALEDEDSKDSSESDSSRDSEDSESESDITEVVFYRWQTVEKKITKSKIEVTFKDHF